MVVSRLTAAILFLIAWVSVGAACEAEDVAVYNIKLQFLRDDIDRSELQWTNIFGQSHNRSYALYKEGEEVGPLIKTYINTGNVQGLNEVSDEEPKVYDQFTAKAGNDAEIMVLVNGVYSLVSFISQMTPSSQWFAGVDSLPLCVNSFWVEEITLELQPLQLVDLDDFGKENAKVVKRVKTQGHKDHTHHPTIATVKFTKVKEYSALEVNNLARKEMISELNSNKLKTLSRQKSYYDDNESYDELLTKNDDLDRLKALEEEPFGTQKPGLPENNVVVVTRKPRQHGNTVPGKRINDLKNMDEVVLAVANGRKLGLQKHLPRHFRSRLHHAVNRHLDCQVSDWGTWSKCTEPCGAGRTVRMRTILQQRQGEGRGCPHLIESKTCGHSCRGDDDYEP